MLLGGRGAADRLFHSCPTLVVCTGRVNASGLATTNLENICARSFLSLLLVNIVSLRENLGTRFTSSFQEGAG